MQVLFQPPVFRLQPRVIPLVTTTPVVTIPTPILTTPVYYPLVTYPAVTFQYYQPPTTFFHVPFSPLSQIKIKVVFHGTHRPGHARGPFSISVDATYDSPPSRDTLRSNLSILATQHGLGNRVSLRQARLYLTRDVSTPVVLAGATAAPPADHVVRTVELRDGLPVREFNAVMEGIRGRQYGAVLVVNVNTRAEIERQRNEVENEAENGDGDSVSGSDE